MSTHDWSIFRLRALSHYLKRDQEGSPRALRVAPAWTWAIVWVLTGLVGVALVLAFAVRMEVRGAGRGVVRLASGMQPLVLQAGGSVARIAVSNGQRIRPGDVILELDAASIQSQLLEAERAVQQLEQVTRPAQAAMDALYRSQASEAERRLVAQQELVTSQEQSIGLYERKLKANQDLFKNGLVSAITVEDAKESLTQALRSLNAARQSLMSARQELAGFHSRREEELLRRQQEAQAILTKRDALAFSLRQTRLTASQGGVVDGLFVRPGDVVAPGQAIGRLVPEGQALRAFAVLPEKDRASVHPGDRVRLEVDQYPVADYGALQAQVVRVSEGPATQADLREALGEDVKVEGVHYLVEMAIPAGQTRRVASQTLRSGMALQARYVLRRERPILLLLEPLRRWLA